MADNSREYEKQHHTNIAETQKTLLQLYEEAIDRIYVYASGLNLINNEFNLAQYPTLQAVIDRELITLSTRIEVAIVNGIRGSWELSQTKFGALISKQYYRSETMPDVVNTIVYNPQERALETFIQRKREGLNLSERVWKYNNKQFRAEIENNLFAGISEGKGAAEMARQQKRYLRNPDDLFRRVRDAKGKLVLSKAAKAYKPGVGVYRSAYKNALRLTQNEINKAYRTADHLRWKATKFILGIEIRLSPQHPTNVEAIRCDLLTGIYPPDYKFTGQHIGCYCLAIPVLPSMEEFKEYQQYLLRGEGDKFKFTDVVKEIPQSTIDYVNQNRGIYAKWKNLPQYITDNPKLLTF